MHNFAIFCSAHTIILCLECVCEEINCAYVLHQKCMGHEYTNEQLKRVAILGVLAKYKNLMFYPLNALSKVVSIKLIHSPAICLSKK